MKKLVISILMLTAGAACAMAQVSVGAGFLSQTSKTTISNSSSSDNYNGFYAGADFAYGLGHNISVVPGLYYGYLTSKSDIAGIAEATTVCHNLMIPVNIRYTYPILNELDVFAYAGPVFNVGLAATTTGSIAGFTSEVDLYADNEFSRKRFDLGIDLGVGFDIANLIRINVGYTFGLLDLDKIDSSTTRNNTLNVGVAFLF